MVAQIPSLLIVGVKEGGIGHAVWKRATDYADEEMKVHGADLGDVVSEATCTNFDIRSANDRRCIMSKHEPCHVLVTTGINLYGMEDYSDPEWEKHFMEMLHVNTVGVLALAREWSDRMVGFERDGIYSHMGWHFAAISSNSAHIARSMSAMYCASKAALSMGMRCLARDAARQGEHQALYVYEPGWVNGTPMSVTISGSEDNERQNARFHRIPSQLGLNKNDLAKVIMDNFTNGWNIMNGACIRLDGGEQ